jgi:signal transduction histidine kinase
VNWHKSRDGIKLILSLLWLAFTVAFAIWWMTFSVDHIDQLTHLQPAESAHWLRQRHMVITEGITWMVLLVLGGGALVLLVQREKRRLNQVREFFASFSHEVKTSLASLRLQGEALKDEWSGPASPILDRLIGDTVRLQVQLENSLFLASQDDLKLYLEGIRLSRVVDGLRQQWPQIKIELKGDAVVRADERALRTVFTNLMQNALVHGNATQMSFTVEALASGGGAICVRAQDNGEGFDGSLQDLGQLFHRPKSSSGSGLGIYICRLLVDKMNGQFQLHADNQGFRADVIIPRESK